jgi:hypothetical protein
MIMVITVDDFLLLKIPENLKRLISITDYGTPGRTKESGISKLIG